MLKGVQQTVSLLFNGRYDNGYCNAFVSHEFNLVVSKHNPLNT